jgi:hypothetical protein
MSRTKRRSSGNGVEWAEPPASISYSGRHAVLWATLKAHPGKWAIFKRKFTGSTSSYGKGKPDFEFTLRTEPDGTRTCYVRFVGKTGR